MAKAKECDRCGNLYRPVYRVHNEIPRDSKKNCLYLHCQGCLAENMYPRDLCPECEKSLVNWWLNGRNK